MRAREVVMVVAGEPSGDARAGEVLFELQKLVVGIETYGLGGPRLAELGHESLVPLRELSVMGFGEVIGRLGRFRDLLRDLVNSVDARRPALAILVDYPDFNLRLARRLKKKGVRVVGYVSPQVWAWRPGRVGKIARWFDRMIVILPFEERVYRQAGMAVDFVGHPLVGRVRPSRGRAEFRESIGVRGDEALVGLCPGSRMQELERIGPVMRDAVRLMRRVRPTLRAVVAGASSLPASAIQNVFGGDAVISSETYDVMHWSDVLAVASGTATLEAAIAGTPFAVVYRTDALSYALARSLVRLRDIGLVNVVAGKRVVPELVQSRANPPGIARALEGLLADSNQRSRMEDELARVSESLGAPGAAERAAAIIAQELKR